MFFGRNDKTLEEKVLIEIDDLQKKDVYPSVWKIAKNLWKEKSLNSILIAIEKLEKKNFIQRNENKKIVAVTNSGKAFLDRDIIKFKNILRTVSLPILGSIPCWDSRLAYEDIKGYVELSQDIHQGINSDEYFLLEADGDSMNQNGIVSGDLLLMKTQSYAKNWDIVIALLSHESATLKEFWQNKLGFVQLIPHSTNERHKTIIVNAEDITIQGVLIKNLGNFNS